MATAAASRRGRFPVGRRGAEKGELFVDGAALAFRAGNFFPRRENNRLKAVLALRHWYSNIGMAFIVA